MVTAVLLGALLDASAAVAQGDDANAAAVRAVLEAQAAAWNRGDIDAYMDGYAREETTTFISGDTVTRGWKTVLDRYKRNYDTREKMGTLAFTELDLKPSCPHGQFALSCTSCRHADGRHRIVVEELSGVGERPMIIRMSTTSRPQQRYDHRLRDLVQRTGDLTIATDLGVPRSTARGWLRAARTVVVSLEVADLTEAELRQEIVELRRRVEKLAALLRLALVLLHTSGFRLSRERLPDGPAKLQILRAVDRARECIPLRAVVRFLRVSPSRFQAWRRRQTACALDDQSSCPRTSPHRLTLSEVKAIGDMVTSPEYRHVPTGTLAVLAQRLGTVSASPSTWYRLVRKYGWRRPRVRVHPAKPKVGLRTTGADEVWHIDTTVIRVLDGTRAYLHAVIDNFSRRILAWRVVDTFAPINNVAVLLEASRSTTRSASTPVVLADAGVENVNAQVDELIATGILRRLLAFTELKFSNSMIEAWWRSLKHHWLFLHSLDSVATIRQLVAFYVREHNHVLPHSAFRGQTPDEMYFGTGNAVPTDLTARAAAARRARVEANRSASCKTCPLLSAA